MNLTDKTKRKISLYYGIAMSVLLTVCGILFICSCYSIYKSGQSPFTRESISNAFSEISAVVYITLAVVIVGIGLDILLPDKDEKLKGARTYDTLAEELGKRVDLESAEEEKKAVIENSRGIISVLKNVRTVLVIASAVLPLFYLLNPDNFPAESGQYNNEILHGMLLYMLFLAPLAIFEVVFVILKEVYLKKEISALKEVIKQNGISAPKENEHKGWIDSVKDFFKCNSKPMILGIRIAFVGCAIGFIVAGILNGGMNDVLNKAVKICTECIGLG